jgi:two-component system, NtrC family, nitrogen regulation sensor histidine kinase GlnL
LNNHRKILEHLTNVVLLFDENQTLCFANSAAEDLWQTSYQNLIRLPASAILQCSENNMDALFERALINSQPYTERELILLFPGFRQLTVNCTITPINDEKEILVEIQQLDHQLKINREEHLIQYNEVTRQIVRNLAHEIKNPLGGIRGAAQLLERELPTDNLKEYTSVIIEESDRLSKLLNRLLGPNKLPQPEAINIHQVLERVRAIVGAEVTDGITIKQDFDPSIPLFQGDMDQLIQAFLNITRNAFQALGQSGTITLKTRVQRQQTIGNTRHKLVIKADIIDDGPGVIDDILEKIFYPMVTSRAEGSGLGLSIAQMLINQHNGLIECQSQPGHTVFSVLLPLRKTS